ncbi:DoxX family membrane protein [Candidatus Parcubacteria bacterium]|nr:DoxX family membrane protein [Candidatus Parcubacteria bacterium]
MIPKAYAHEAYVLTPLEVERSVSAPSPNPFSALSTEGGLFLLSVVAAIIMAVIVFKISTSPAVGRVCNPILLRLKKYAPLIGRLTLGLSLFASGYYGAAFGPELALPHSLSPLLMILGVLIFFGWLTRPSALVGIALFIFMIAKYRLYMLTYVNYLGEMILALIIGGGLFKKLEPYGFLILRVCFGTAIVFASLYAKLIHSNLALQTISEYHLTNFFPFSPLFLVLGAFLTELAIGLCFILGFGIRIAALVFIFFLILSIMYFGEAVWPHIILFGVNLALFAHGYDKYTLGNMLRGKASEPVL